MDDVAAHPHATNPDLVAHLPVRYVGIAPLPVHQRLRWHGLREVQAAPYRNVSLVHPYVPPDERVDWQDYVVVDEEQPLPAALDEVLYRHVPGLGYSEPQRNVH